MSAVFRMANMVYAAINRRRTMSQNNEESEGSKLSSDIHIRVCTCTPHTLKYEWSTISVKSHSVHISGLSGHAVPASSITNSATVATKLSWTVNKRVNIAQNFIEKSKLHQM